MHRNLLYIGYSSIYQSIDGLKHEFETVFCNVLLRVVKLIITESVVHRKIAVIRFHPRRSITIIIIIIIFVNTVRDYRQEHMHLDKRLE